LSWDEFVEIPGASPSELNSNFVCFCSILPDPLVPVNSHYLRKLFSTVLLGIKGGVPLPDFDAFGCLRTLRARSALGGVSWAQGG
jgi:hypothetical protein